MDEGIRQRIERWKVIAEIFLKNKTKAFIIDIKNDYHWCYITKVNEDDIEIKNFDGSRKYEEERIYWAEIFKFDEYVEKKEGVGFGG